MPISMLIYMLFLEFVLMKLLPQSLTASVLIGRLINANCHLLALRISEYLGMNQVSLSLPNNKDLH